MYAVIEQCGKQHRIRSGAEVTVDRLSAAIGDSLELDKVLMLYDDQQYWIGPSAVAGAKVTVQVIAHTQGKKIRVFKMKRRKNYRRTAGSRAQQTRLKVISITPPHC